MVSHMVQCNMRANVDHRMLEQVCRYLQVDFAEGTTDQKWERAVNAAIANPDLHRHVRTAQGLAYGRLQHARAEAATKQAAKKRRAERAAAGDNSDADECCSAVPNMAAGAAQAADKQRNGPLAREKRARFAVAAGVGSGGGNGSGNAAMQAGAGTECAASVRLQAVPIGNLTESVNLCPDEASRTGNAPPAPQRQPALPAASQQAVETAADNADNDSVMDLCSSPEASPVTAQQHTDHAAAGSSAAAAQDAPAGVCNHVAVPCHAHGSS